MRSDIQPNGWNDFFLRTVYGSFYSMNFAPEKSGSPVRISTLSGSYCGAFGRDIIFCCGLRYFLSVAGNPNGCGGWSCAVSSRRGKNLFPAKSKFQENRFRNSATKAPLKASRTKSAATIPAYDRLCQEIDILWILAIGILVQGGWEFVLAITGIRNHKEIRQKKTTKTFALIICLKNGYFTKPLPRQKPVLCNRRQILPELSVQRMMNRPKIRQSHIRFQKRIHDKGLQAQVPKDFEKPVAKLKNGNYKMKSGIVYLCFSTDFLIEEADAWRKDCWNMICL